MGLVKPWSVLRVKSPGRVLNRREIVTLLGCTGLVVGAAWTASEGETNLVSRYLSVNGAVALSWVLLLVFAYLLVGIGWLRLRDAGVVPLAYARRSGEGWALGSLTRVLFGRMVRFMPGDVVEIGADKSYPASTGSNPRMMYEWSLRAPGARLAFRTIYPLGPDQIAALSAWLLALGLDSDACR